MSLRVRLVLLTVALVTLVAVALSVLSLNELMNALSAEAQGRSELASQQVNAFIIDHVNQHSGDYATPANLEETKNIWTEIVATDHDVSNMLERTVAQAPALLEVNVAGESGTILVSSNPGRVGHRVESLETMTDWRRRPFYRRLFQLIVRRPNYQVSNTLGITGQPDPIFTVQLVTSGVLLRNAVLPEIETLGAVSGAALLISLTLTIILTDRVLQPLKRIEHTIDRIAKGNFGEDDAGKKNLSSQRREQAKEFAALESKLNLLGQQFSFERQDATKLKSNLDEMIERMASQLDVASRLAAISRISGNVAHEIKNPLNAIALRLDLLRERASAGASEEELLPEIDVLSKEVRRLDRVVKTFLDFSRPVEVSFSDVDLVAVAREVTYLMGPQARAAGIDLSFEGPDEPAIMRGDADMLKQVILNLVTNALEAMKAGGKLRVSVTPDDDTLKLEVADNGPGIPPELRDKVFQLYFTTKERGSGIGLAMTYRAAQLHNGTVEFDSETGRGTTFRLTFPALVRHA